MANTSKKKWSTPRLRIFVRTRAEERVLAGCKVPGMYQGPNNSHVMCWVIVTTLADCDPCSSNSES